MQTCVDGADGGDEENIQEIGMDAPYGIPVNDNDCSLPRFTKALNVSISGKALTIYCFVISCIIYFLRVTYYIAYCRCIRVRQSTSEE